MPKKFAPLTEEQKKAKREGEHQTLNAAIENLSSEVGFQRWLKVRTTASLRRFSFYNQTLIAYQKPDAQLIRTFKGWGELGRKVKKGESAILVLRPIIKTIEETNPLTGEIQQVKKLIGFAGLKEFDINQTDGEPVDFTEFVIGTDTLTEHIEKLVAYAGKLGYTVEFRSTDLHGANGFCDSKAKQIVVKDGRAIDDQVRTLIHEIAHAHEIDYTKFTREDAEIIVEVAAAVLLIRLGIEDISTSAQYIASWSGGDIAQVKARTAIADKVADKIEDALGLAA